MKKVFILEIGCWYSGIFIINYGIFCLNENKSVILKIIFLRFDDFKNKFYWNLMILKINFVEIWSFVYF